MPIQTFVIEFIDPSTGCIKDEAIIETEDVDGLCATLDLSVCEIPPGVLYDLDADDLRKLSAHFESIRVEAGLAATLRAAGIWDELPYKLHTNRELAMMLAGEKPFAAFSEWYPQNGESEMIPERFFEPYVASGVFVKRECVLPAKNLRLVLYAHKAEEWRIETYLLLKDVAEKIGWSEAYERMEGTLLGYREWQNDAFIEQVYNRRNNQNRTPPSAC